MRCFDCRSDVACQLGDFHHVHSSARPHLFLIGSLGPQLALSTACLLDKARRRCCGCWRRHRHVHGLRLGGRREEMLLVQVGQPIVVICKRHVAQCRRSDRFTFDRA